MNTKSLRLLALYPAGFPTPLSPQFLHWALAFEAWLDQRASRYQAGVTKQALLAFRRLLHHQPRPLWDFQPSHLVDHLAWLQQQGYAPSSIANTVGIFNNFYTWLPSYAAATPGFTPSEITNPAQGLQRPTVRRYASGLIWSSAEVDRFLAFVHSSATPLGQRDYAFFLARLTLGVPTRWLQRLTWSQLSPSLSPTIPAPVQAAIERYLHASGRWPTRRPAMYIFAPLRYPGQPDAGARLADWLEDHPLSSSALLGSLKVYGRALGLPENKLNLFVLRRTAIRLHLAASPDPQSFLGSAEHPRSTKYRLKFLPSPSESSETQLQNAQPPPPSRRASPFQPGDHLTHGLYASQQPQAAIQSILAEDLHGLAEQIAGLRQLGNRLLELLAVAPSPLHAGRLGELYTLLAARLADLLKYERRLAAHPPDPWIDRLIDFFNDHARLNHTPLTDRSSLLAEALSSSSSVDPSETQFQMDQNRSLTTEIAATRYILRNTLQLALAASTPLELIHLIEIYSIACNRLLRLLKADQGADSDAIITAYIQKMIEQAAHAVLVELKSPLLAEFASAPGQSDEDEEEDDDGSLSFEDLEP